MSCTTDAFRFQWADLQVKHLTKLKFEVDIKHNLGKLPATLEEAYSQVWNEIRSDTPYSQKIAEKALMWIMCSSRGLNREEWAKLTF